MNRDVVLCPCSVSKRDISVNDCFMISFYAEQMLSPEDLPDYLQPETVDAEREICLKCLRVFEIPLLPSHSTKKGRLLRPKGPIYGRIPAPFVLVSIPFLRMIRQYRGFQTLSYHPT